MFRGLELAQLRVVLGLVVLIFAGGIVWQWRRSGVSEPMPLRAAALNPSAPVGISTAPSPTPIPIPVPSPNLAHATPVGRVEAAPQKPSALIDLNTATADELEMLPLVGSAKAQEIVRDRTERGPFRSVEDLDRVSGFGEKTVQRLRPYLTASAPSAGEAARPAASAPHPSPPEAAPAKRIPINRATKEELEQLKGVGPRLADNILVHRRVHGPFRSPQDLLKVKGIGPKILQQNSAVISFE